MESKSSLFSLNSSFPFKNYIFRRFKYSSKTHGERMADWGKIWDNQLPGLLDAYMEYKYSSPSNHAGPEFETSSFTIAVLGVTGMFHGGFQCIVSKFTITARI